jgi:hypothetical protein
MYAKLGRLVTETFLHLQQCVHSPERQKFASRGQSSTLGTNKYCKQYPQDFPNFLAKWRLLLNGHLVLVMSLLADGALALSRQRREHDDDGVVPGRVANKVTELVAVQPGVNVVIKKLFKTKIWIFVTKNCFL